MAAAFWWKASRVSSPDLAVSLSEFQSAVRDRLADAAVRRGRLLTSVRNGQGHRRVGHQLPEMLNCAFEFSVGLFDAAAIWVW
jgi:hypothetical protein